MARFKTRSDRRKFRLCHKAFTFTDASVYGLPILKMATERIFNILVIVSGIYVLRNITE